MRTLRDIVTEALDRSPTPDPKVVAAEVVAAMPARDLRVALAETLPAYVTAASIHQRNQAMRGTERAGPSRSSRYEAAASFLNEPMCVGHNEWKWLGDCTADDLDAAAAGRRGRAESIVREAERWEGLAALLRRRRVATVADLDEDAVAEVLAA